MKLNKHNRKRCSFWMIALLVLLLSLLPCSVWAVVDAPEAIYVGDYANVLSDETEQYIIAENQKLATATGAQIVVVTVDFLDGMEIEDYAYTIFNDWGIGDAERNNGLLLLLAIGEDNYYAMQGQGLEGVISSGTLGDYLYDYLEDDFAVGDYDAGVYRVFNAFLNWFDTYYDDYGQTGTVQGSIPSTMPNQSYTTGYTEKGDGMMWLIVVLLIVIIILLLSIHNRRKDKKNKKNKNNRPGGGSGGGCYYDTNDRGEFAPPRRKTVYVPNGRMGVPRSPKKSNSSKTSVPSDLFGGGSSRGGGAGRRSSTFGSGFGDSSGGFSGGFGGGSSRGGGAGRR